MSSTRAFQSRTSLAAAIRAERAVRQRRGGRLGDLPVSGASGQRQPVRGGVGRGAVGLDPDRLILQGAAALQELGVVELGPAALGPAGPGGPGLELARRQRGDAAIEALVVVGQEVEPGHVADPLVPLAAEDPPDRRGGRPRRLLEPQAGREPEDDRRPLQDDLVEVAPLVELEVRHAVVDDHLAADQVGPLRQLRGLDRHGGGGGGQHRERRRPGPPGPGIVRTVMAGAPSRARRGRASRGLRAPWGG